MPLVAAQQHEVGNEGAHVDQGNQAAQDKLRSYPSLGGLNLVKLIVRDLHVGVDTVVVGGPALHGLCLAVDVHIVYADQD